MTSVRPEHVRQACAAIDRHRAALDTARARLDRAANAADRLEALRRLEASLSAIGRRIGETRRLDLLRHRNQGTGS